MPVEVFKTNVNSRRSALKVLKMLSLGFPELSCNFDLEDCDRILRVQSKGDLQLAPLIEAVQALGHEVAVLSDEPFMINTK